MDVHKVKMRDTGLEHGMKFALPDEGDGLRHHVRNAVGSRRSVNDFLPSHDHHFGSAVAFHLFLGGIPGDDLCDADDDLVADFFIQMLQREGQGVVIVLHHLLGFVGGLLVLAQEADGSFTGGERAFDHAGKYGFVDDGVVQHLRKYRLVKDGVPACKRSYAVALALNGGVQNKPKGSAILITQGQLDGLRFSCFLQSGPESGNGHGNRQAVDDLLPRQIPVHELCDQLLHNASSYC